MGDDARAGPQGRNPLPPEEDPLAEARLRGLGERDRLLREAGGAVDAQGAARMLGLPIEAVEAWREEGRLLAVDAGEHGRRYPVCQFGRRFGPPSGGAVIGGLERVLGAIEDDPGGWMRLAFLLSPEERLGGERPIDVLGRGEVEAVERAARSYGEHGAY